MQNPRLVLIGTQGTSPGVIPEAYSSIVDGRVEPKGVVPKARIEKVYIVATSHPLVATAAKAAAAILVCCLDHPPDAIEVVIEPYEDVVDATAYGSFYRRVRELLEDVIAKLRGRRDLVILDVTGGRVGMALAAFEAAYTMLGREKLVVTTTQVPPEEYKRLQSLYDEIRAKHGEELEKALDKLDCEILGEAGLCKLVTRRARTSVIWPPA